MSIFKETKMKKFIKLGAVLLTMVSSVFAGSTVIPSDLQWPLKNKGVADTSIFFGVEDAVDVPKGDARNCDANGDRGGSKTHFDRHLVMTLLLVLELKFIQFMKDILLQLEVVKFIKELVGKILWLLNIIIMVKNGPVYIGICKIKV
jgi:hypothetical protein